MESPETLPLLAGQRQDGQLIYEELPVKALGGDNYRLLRSPAFCKGIARDDEFCRMAAGRFEVTKHSGMLAVTIIAREHIDRIAEQLKPHLPDLKAVLDEQTDRMLVLSIPVESGFELIEGLLSDALAQTDQCTWYYGNVYDPADGTTPLNWWKTEAAPAVS